jgi:hypothetical protein
VAKISTGGPHAAPETVERYVRGDLPRAEGRELERHLVGCVACQAAVAAAGEAKESTVRWRGHRFARQAGAAPAESPIDERRRALLRGLGTAADAFGAALLAELLAASEHRRRTLVARQPRFASLPLAERLAGSCRAAWLDDPDLAVELARLAVAVASRLDAHLYGATQVADARALAWSQLGNSYRIAGANDTGAPGLSHAGQIAEGIPPAYDVKDQEDGEGAPYPPPWVPGSTIGEVDEAALPVSALAVAALDETRAAALARGMTYEAALVTLDLAAAHLRRGDPGAARELLAQAPALLAAAGLEAEAVGRFRALAEAAAGGSLAQPLLQDVADYLGRARNDPSRRFARELGDDR